MGSKMKQVRQGKVGTIETSGRSRIKWSKTGKEGKVAKTTHISYFNIKKRPRPRETAPEIIGKPVEYKLFSLLFHRFTQRSIDTARPCETTPEIIGEPMENTRFLQFFIGLQRSINTIGDSSNIGIHQDLLDLFEEGSPLAFLSADTFQLARTAASKDYSFLGHFSS